MFKKKKNKKNKESVKICKKGKKNACWFIKLHLSYNNKKKKSQETIFFIIILIRGMNFSPDKKNYDKMF